jgi:hypothetical protein
MIIASGGVFQFVEVPGLRIIDTCALTPTGGGSCDLTKIGRA